MYVGACEAIRLYLGASLCTYHFLALDVFFWAIHVRGRYIYFVISVSCFTAYLIYIYDVIH